MRKKSVDTDPQVDQVAVMEANGYQPATKVAEKLGVSRMTLSRWADAGHVESELMGHRRYIKIDSLIKHIGENQARLFGFL